MTALDHLFDWRTMAEAPQTGAPIIIRCGEEMARCECIQGYWVARAGGGHAHGLTRPDWQWTPCIAELAA